MPSQPTLFAPPAPEGFAYTPGLITPAEESALAAALETLAFERFDFHGHLALREVVGFGWHRDKAHFDVVAGVSLLSPCTMRFRRRTATGWDRLAVPLAPRSAYLLTGPARHDWEHSIAAHAEPRFSITFRTLAA